MELHAFGFIFLDPSLLDSRVFEEQLAVYMLTCTRDISLDVDGVLMTNRYLRFHHFHQKKKEKDPQTQSFRTSDWDL
ncbi:hypothetical protein SCA6_002935 [Theobroma cacao]